MEKISKRITVDTLKGLIGHYNATHTATQMHCWISTISRYTTRITMIVSADERNRMGVLQDAVPGGEMVVECRWPMLSVRSSEEFLTWITGLLVSAE